MVETCKMAQYPFSGTQPIQDLDWEMYLKETANQIVQKPQEAQLGLHKTRIYCNLDLFITFNIFQVIFVGLQKELVKNCDGELKPELCQIAAFYKYRLLKGNKAICYMEAFMAKFMAIYMKFVEDMFGGF